MSIFDHLREKFTVLKDGKYIVRVDGYVYEKTRNDQRPIRWDLRLMENIEGVLPSKFDHVESDIGFEILMNQIVQMGFLRPETPEELEATLNSLIGKLVEVEVKTDGEYRNVYFTRCLNNEKW